MSRSELALTNRWGCLLSYRVLAKTVLVARLLILEHGVK